MGRTMDDGLIAALASLRDELIEPPDGFAERVAARLGLRWRAPVRRIAHDRRARYAAAGVVLGAAAAAIVIRRRRAAA